MYHKSEAMPTPTLLLWVLACCICSIHAFSLTNLGSRRTPAATAAVSNCLSNTATPTASAPRRSHLGPRISTSVPFIANKLRQYGARDLCMVLASATSSEESSSSAATAPSPSSDGEALQSLFAKHCNEGLMGEDDLRSIPVIKDMLEQGDMLSSELTEIWKAAPKFTQVIDPGEEESTVVDKIDGDSFIQVYRDINDLFEEDNEEEGEEGNDGSDNIVVKSAATENDAVVGVSEEEEGGKELKQTFATLGNDDSPVSFLQLRQWEELVFLIEEEGTLGEDELVTLWENSLDVKGTGGSMELQGFVKFNNALDELFEFDEEEEKDDVESKVEVEDEEEAPAQPTAPRPIITEEDLPSGVLFSQLANENYLVGKDDLQRWGELSGMLKEGDLTMDELNTLFDAATKAPGTKDMLDEDGFCVFYDAIDSLFEDVDDDSAEQQPLPLPAERELKEELLEFIEDIAKLSEEEGQLKCGLDGSDLEQERVLEVVSELEREPYNGVLALSATGEDAIKKEQLVGMWDLIYSSSSTMKYNEGLSGLAGGLTRFGGLQQMLSATKYLSDVEYTEQVVGKFGGQLTEVKVTGDWDLRTEVSLFTGKPSNVMSVVPDKVFYGPRKDKADHWKSLGPMNLLLLSYLDEDLRVMRGNTSTDTLFIWRRTK